MSYLRDVSRLEVILSAKNGASTLIRHVVIVQPSKVGARYKPMLRLVDSSGLLEDQCPCNCQGASARRHKQSDDRPSMAAHRLI
jgi:hypothetical protein